MPLLQRGRRTHYEKNQTDHPTHALHGSFALCHDHGRHGLLGSFLHVTPFALRAPTRGFYDFQCSVPVGTQKSRHAGACGLTVCDNVLPPQELTYGGLILVQGSSASGCSSGSSCSIASPSSFGGVSVIVSVTSVASASSSARVMMSTKKSFFLMPRSLR